jgi:hypothetical protein
VKTFIIRFTNLHKAAKDAHTYVEADRYKCTDEHYIFYDGDGNTLAQYERRNVVGVDDITSLVKKNP